MDHSVYTGAVWVFTRTVRGFTADSGLRVYLSTKIDIEVKMRAIKSIIG